MANRRTRLIRTNPKLQQERAYRRWSQGEDSQLRGESAGGMPLHEIALRHKRSQLGIVTRCSKLGLPVHRVPGHEEEVPRRSVRPPMTIADPPTPTRPVPRLEPELPARRGFLRRLFK